MKKGISQELLRTLAMVTMLIDHVGCTMFPRLLVLRYIGRLAFPIFAFLIAEGAEKTCHPGKYALRLLIAAAISEVPFDLMITGRVWDPGHQNVMITLLLGLLAIYALKYSQGMGPSVLGAGVLAAFFCTCTAQVLKTDYGAFGVLTCLAFWLLWHRKFGPVLSAAAFTALCFWRMKACIPGTPIPIELLGVLSVPVMAVYNGKRLTKNKLTQWAFYAYYPVHMAALVAVRMMLRA